MESTDPGLEEALFDRALQEATREGRRAFLDGVCEGKAGLRARLEVLLGAHEAAAEGFLPGPPPAAGMGGGGGGAGDERTGEAEVHIGRYKLLERIGEGGFGEVWRAEQQVPVQRLVALKIIKPGMDSRQVVARFEAERQALAMMDHPNIARILDADLTDAGRPYFVMELVTGVRITEFCDQHRLSIRERLGLFIQVCKAIQHAHQKGIIHRDIKPSNVLVTLQDGPASAGLIKVIDFGIAKATQQPLTHGTVITHFQHFIGTPAYISPEQAGLNGVDIDTRADIYSLGVMLYEVLVGRTPFDPRDMTKDGLDSLLRIIREKSPPKPSTRLRSLSAVDGTTTAGRRGTEPARLMHLMCGDLDWIVMKCLEKDRARRYDTVTGLGRDLERYLANEPVAARPPSVGYRTGKWVRRNRLPLAATALMLLALAVGVAMVILVQQRANREVRRLLYAAEMGHAGNEWRAGHSGSLLAILERCPPDHRDWEWRLLMRSVNDWEETALPLNPQGLSGAALSADERWLAVGVGEVIEIREFPSGRAVRSFPFQSSPWNADFALAPRGDLLAITLATQVTVWNVSTGEEIARMDSGSTRVLAWSDDGNLLAFAAPGSEVQVWDLRTRRVRTALNAHAAIRSLAFGPDAQTIAMGIEGIGVEWVDLETGALRRILRTRDRAPRSMGFSPDGKMLATSNISWGGHGADNRIWSLDAGEGSMDLTGTGDLLEFDFHPDHRRLALGDDYGIIHLWDLERRSQVEQFPAHAGRVLLTRWLSDGRLFSVGAEGSARFWKPRWNRIEQLRGYPGSLRTVAFSPDSRWLAAAGLGSGVWLWDVARGSHAGTYAAHGVETETVAAAFSPGGDLASAGEDQGLRLWEPASRQTIWSSSLAPETDAWSLAFSPDSRRLYAASHRDSVTVLDAGSCERLKTITGFGDVVDGIAVSPDGRLLAVCHKTMLSVWLADGSRELWRVPANPNRSAAFSPDGQWLATGDTDGTVSLWEVASHGRTRRILLGHTAAVTGVSFHPGGTRLASAGMDGAVILWDYRSATGLLTLAAPGSRILWHVAFSPDGTCLAAGGGDGVITVWKSE